MTEHQMLRLAAIHRRNTRYEVAVETTPPACGENYLLGYTPRTSRHGMMALMRSNAATLSQLTHMDDTHLLPWRKTTGVSPYYANLGNGWIVRFTGRTEREAILGGEMDRATLKTPVAAE